MYANSMKYTIGENFKTTSINIEFATFAFKLIVQRDDDLVRSFKLHGGCLKENGDQIILINVN